MDKEKKKIIAGVGILGGASLIYLLTRKGAAAPPPPPPPPDKANLYGQVTDAVTGHSIEGIQVSFAEYAGVTDPNGYYLIENIIPGGYEVTFYDPVGIYESVML